MSGYRAGIVGVFGQTNVGKSTFLNAVFGRKIVITSDKPQTTRNQIRCILSTEEAQIVFVDTPGLHQPKNQLGRHILREAYRGLRGIDILVYMVEPTGAVNSFDRDALQRLEGAEYPIILLVNKIDRARGNLLEETLLAYAATEQFAEIIPVSALTEAGIEETIKTIVSYLPIRPALFPPEIEIDRAEEFLIAEIIREKAYALMHQELPYSLAVHVKWMRERPDRSDQMIEIRAELVVERESQKGIVVGRQGRTIKRIGTSARTDIQAFLGRPVFLDLIVKVLPNWTRDEQKIRELTD